MFARQTEICILLIAFAATSGCSRPAGNKPESCAPLDVFPDLDELDSTPREDLEAEVLALTCSEGWVADQDLYDQLRDALGAIRQADPHMANLTDHRVRSPGQDLIVQATDNATRDRFIKSEVPDFTCVVDALSASAEPWDRDEEGWMVVSVQGVLVADGLVAVFERIPGMENVEPNHLIGDGHSIVFDFRSEPGHVLFDEDGGDCPAGCPTHHYYLWEVPSDASPALVAEWGVSDGTSSFGMPPTDFSFNDFTCRRCDDGRVAQGEVELCDDGIDNDCNGQTDCDDRACEGATVCEGELCGNEMDDDADGLTDCDDDDCAFNALCGTETCGSDTDQEFLLHLADRGIENFILRNASACTQVVEREPSLTIADCITQTFTNNDVSFGCGRCLGEFGECAMTDCRASCEPDFRQPTCATCYGTSCSPAAETCLGEPLSSLGR